MGSSPGRVVLLIANVQVGRRLDCYELTRRLKGDPRTDRIPILAVTGYVPFRRDAGRAGRAGCDAILPKPCSPEALEPIMRCLIEEARWPRSA